MADERTIGLFDVARLRVEGEPELMPYRDTILYPRAEEDVHWAWVAIAPVADILDWAKTVAEEREQQT